MDAFHKGHGQRLADAPEAIHQHSDLILAETSQDNQLPEALPRSHESYAGDTKAKHTWDSHLKSNARSVDEKLFVPTIDNDMKRKHRQRWIWVLIALVILLLAIGLGVGLGFGLSSNAHASNQPNAAASNESQSS